MVELLWKFLWEMICTPYLLFKGAVIEFPKKRNRPVSFVSIVAEAVSYCFKHVEGSDSDDENQKRFAFLPEKTKKAYKEAEKILGDLDFSYRIEGRDLHLILLEDVGKPLPDKVWEELGRLLDETGGKDFRTDMRDGLSFIYFHELVFPHQEGEAEKKIVPIPSEKNKRIDSILFLAICAGLYWVYLHTGNWVITALTIIAFSVVRRALFYSIIKFLVAKWRPGS